MSDSEDYSDSDVGEDQLSASDSGSEFEGATELKNQPFDEAVELSDDDESLSVADSKGDSPKKAKDLKNQEYDHALELSDSMHSPVKINSTAPKAAETEAAGTEIKNKPFDEQVDLSDSDSSIDTQASSPKAAAVKRPSVVNMEPIPQSQPKVADLPTTQAKPSEKAVDSDVSSSEPSDSEDDDDASAHDEKVKRPPVEGAYDEKDYAHLNVSQEVKELFQYIGRFKPQDIELETRLKCFIPEYIPAVGEIDAFIKIPRVDGEQDNLGLKVLDEPALIQSDATVLDLKLRAMSKKKHGKIVVRSIENAEKNPTEVDRWIRSISDLHRTKPPPQVHYSKSMPDIESLMQVWPEEFEELLNRIALPEVDTDMTLEEQARLVCAFLDIPIYKNISESLHVFFTLFMEFRNNQHFMNFEQPEHK